MLQSRISKDVRTTAPGMPELLFYHIGKKIPFDKMKGWRKYHEIG